MKFTPFQYTIQVTIDDKTIDYLLTVDETGHVYEAKPVVFELPEAAQKLILKGANKQQIEKINAFTKLVKYILPLALIGPMDAFKTAFDPLVKEIYNRLVQKGMEGLNLSIVSVPEAVASKIYRYAQSHQDSEKKIARMWHRIKKVIEGYPENTTIGYLDRISEEDPEITADFFLAIMPFLSPEGDRCFAFEYLGRTGLAHIKTYLLEELKQSFSRFATLCILRGLLGFEENDEHIYNTAIELYDQNKKKHDFIFIASIVKLLARHPLSRAKEICQEVLHKEKHPASTAAAAALLKMGVPPKDIMDFALPRFNAVYFEISESAFTIFSLDEMPVEYLPDVNTIFDVHIRILSKKYNVSIVDAANQIFSKLGIHHLSTQICSYLTHESIDMQKGMLLLIQTLFNTYPIEHKEVQPYITDEMSKVYFDLANTVDHYNEIARYALRLIAHIGKHQIRKEFIAPLLDVYQRRKVGKQRNTKMETLIAINNVLLNIEYPPELDAFYLEALEEDSRIIKIPALWGLRFSPNKALKESLSRYKHHSDKEISRIAKKLFQRPTKGHPWR